MISLLERAIVEPTRFCVSVPPRHGKSETILHWFAWILRHEPRARIAYVTYGYDFAYEQVRKARRIAQRAGVELGGIDQAGYWETSAGGCVRGIGAQGQINGRGFHFIVVDDPHKSRQEAESPTVRKRTITAFEDDIVSRAEPLGTSVVVVHTRWHVGDLIGFLVKERGWPLVNLPAINDMGEALAPNLWPVSALKQFQANQYSWWSLYQGEPRVRGAEVFQSPTYCTLADIPKGRATIGLDLAYTKKTKSDRSISLVLVEGPKNEAGDPTFYVADVQRRQCQAPEFVGVIRRHRTQWPGARMRWYASGTERGSADFIARDLELLASSFVVNATGDKFVRSQPAADAWNDCRIFVPRDAPWADEFLDVLTHFTGMDGEPDDDVDALAAAFDLFVEPAVRRPRFLTVRGI